MKPLDPRSFTDEWRKMQTWADRPEMVPVYLTLCVALLALGVVAIITAFWGVAHL